MKDSNYFKDYMEFTDKLTKEASEKFKDEKKASFRKHLQNQGLIDDKETDDTDIGGNFKEFVERKENKYNE